MGASRGYRRKGVATSNAFKSGELTTISLIYSTCCKVASALRSERFVVLHLLEDVTPCPAVCHATLHNGRPSRPQLPRGAEEGIRVI